jgi:hypothetical protein
MVLAVATVLLEVLVWEFHTKAKPYTNWFLQLLFLSLVVAMAEIGTEEQNPTEPLLVRSHGPKAVLIVRKLCTSTVKERTNHFWHSTRIFGWNIGSEDLAL